MTNDSAKPIKKADSDRSYHIGIDPAAYEGDIASRLRHWRGLHLAHGGDLFEEAAGEIERLRLTDAEREVIQWAANAMRPECRAVLQGLLDRTAKRDTSGPRNGAVCTPPTQTTPGGCSKKEQGTCQPPR